MTLSHETMTPVERPMYVDCGGWISFLDVGGMTCPKCVEISRDEYVDIQVLKLESAVSEAVSAFKRAVSEGAS